jgi:hypothetical protein
MIAGCDQGAAGQDSITVGSFLDFNAAVSIQTIGKGASEDLGREVTAISEVLIPNHPNRNADQSKNGTIV